MYFEEIQDALDQPRGYLLDILNSICDTKKEKNKTVFFLKSVYLSNP